MAYPLTVCDVDDECIARVAVDKRISVKWDRVLHQAYVTPDAENRAVIGMCRLLLAARDNFIVCPWDDAKAEAEAKLWDGNTALVYCTPLILEMPVFALNVRRTIARINWDLTWSVRWDALEALKSEDAPLLTFNPGIVGLINLLFAAKDNFVCTPW